MKQKITIQVNLEKTIVKVNDNVLLAKSHDNPIRIDPEINIIYLIEQLTKLYLEYKDKYENLHFQPVYDCGCRYDCSCDPSLILYGTRLETDDEYEFRIFQENIAKDAELLKERSEYERLKAKFDDK